MGLRTETTGRRVAERVQQHLLGPQRPRLSTLRTGGPATTPRSTPATTTTSSSRRRRCVWPAGRVAQPAQGPKVRGRGTRGPAPEGLLATDRRGSGLLTGWRPNLDAAGHGRLHGSSVDWGPTSGAPAHRRACCRGQRRRRSLSTAPPATTSCAATAARTSSTVWPATTTSTAGLATTGSTGGSGSDRLFGDAGNDTLCARRTARTATTTWTADPARMVQGGSR